MKRIYRIIIVVLIILSCKPQSKDDSRVKRFEEFMGPEMSKSINLTSELLDSIIVKNFAFNDLDSAYRAFLMLCYSDTINWDQISIDSVELQYVKDKAESSGLIDELYLKLIDIQFDDGVIKYEYHYIPKGDSIALSSVTGSAVIPAHELSNVDSLIREWRQIKVSNHNNRFTQGLELIMESDSTIINYLEFRKIAGSISTHLIAGYFLHHVEGYSDYFVKRIIAVELLL